MRLLSFALLAAVAAGCDFTPTLDIETPAYQDGLVLRSILAADSVATVWVGESWNPYEGRPIDDGSGPELIEADVSLFRDGQLVERLTARRDSCVDLDQPPVPEGGEVLLVPCGPYVGTVPVEAGGTYTVRAEVEGRTPVEGTTTVPRRPTVDVVEEETSSSESRRFRVRIGDPSGAGDRYGLSLLRSTFSVRSTTCENGVCTDSTYVFRTDGRGLTSFDTSDPVVLAASREIAGSGISLATFPDDTFEGRDKTFTITPSPNYVREDTDGPLTIQIATLADDVYDIYQIVAFSGGDDNPFAEPINLPSNVVGGYGLVSAVTLTEVAFGPRQP
ncbi:DUF4249 family protein [Rubrivirga sp.]|uniref:DUF4249 family protein n=1 Tax=Rubrivirga sp. TaxID=1885344 RepID=UPI003B526ED4